MNIKSILLAVAVCMLSGCDNKAVAGEAKKAPIGTLTCYDFKGEVVEYDGPYSSRMTTSYTDTEGIEHETSHPCSFTRYAKK